MASAQATHEAGPGPEAWLTRVWRGAGCSRHEALGPRQWSRGLRSRLCGLCYAVSTDTEQNPPVCRLQGRVKENIFLTAAVSFWKVHRTIPVAVEILEASTQVQQVFQLTAL